MRDQLGPELHDRATRGQELSSEEEQQLQAWYAEMDRAEMEDLGLAQEVAEDRLPTRIEKTLAEIANVTRRIQELDRRAQDIEQENNALRVRLSLPLSAQRA